MFQQFPKTTFRKFELNKQSFKNIELSVGHHVEVIVLQQQVSVTFFALLVADDRRATCQRIFGNSMAIELGPYGFSDSKQQQTGR